MVGSKGGWKLSTIRCKVFLDWSIIKIRKKSYLLDGSIFAGTTSTAFVDLVYWCGLEKGILHFDILSMKFSFHVGCPPSGAKKG